MDSYTKDELRDLISNLYDTTDAFKYFVSVSTSDEPNDDKQELPKLIDDFEDLKICCEEFLSAYNFYRKKYDDYVAKESK